VKDKIREYVLEMGVDDVGFAAVSDYHSPRSPKIQSIFPEARSMVVMAYRELSSCESSNMQIAMNGRMDAMAFSRSCNYKLARYLENKFGAKAMTVPASYPLLMSYETRGSVGDVSLRHAAVAAGLGTLGRHNLVNHPRFGPRVVFTAVLCDLDLTSDPPAKDDPCTECHTCVESCPAGALDEEGKTDVSKCLRHAQPYGLGSKIRFWTKLLDSPPEDQKKMIKDVEFWSLWQAGFIGLQYFCFNCQKVCSAGR